MRRVGCTGADARGGRGGNGLCRESGWWMYTRSLDLTYRVEYVPHTGQVQSGSPGGGLKLPRREHVGEVGGLEVGSLGLRDYVYPNRGASDECEGGEIHPGASAVQGTQI